MTDQLDKAMSAGAPDGLRARYACQAGAPAVTGMEVLREFIPANAG